MQDAKCKKDIHERTFQFACRIVHLHRSVRIRTAVRLCDQVLKSGTSIGANLEEAEAGQSSRFHSEMPDRVERVSRNSLLAPVAGSFRSD